MLMNRSQKLARLSCQGNNKFYVLLGNFNKIVYSGRKKKYSQSCSLKTEKRGYAGKKRHVMKQWTSNECSCLLLCIKKELCHFVIDYWNCT